MHDAARCSLEFLSIGVGPSIDADFDLKRRWLSRFGGDGLQQEVTG